MENEFENHYYLVDTVGAETYGDVAQLCTKISGALREMIDYEIKESIADRGTETQINYAIEFINKAAEILKYADYPF